MNCLWTGNADALVRCNFMTLLLVSADEGVRVPSVACTESGTRTRTALRPRDFKSLVSTIPPFRLRLCRIRIVGCARQNPSKLGFCSRLHDNSANFCQITGCARHSLRKLSLCTRWHEKSASILPDYWLRLSLRCAADLPIFLQSYALFSERTKRKCKKMIIRVGRTDFLR